MSELRVATEQIDAGTVVLTVRGDVDLMTAHELDRVVHAALDNGAARVILDLTHCEVFESELNVLAHTTRPGSLAFSLIVPPDRIPHLTLGITQLDHVFRICPRLQAALDGDEDSMHRTAIGQSEGT